MHNITYDQGQILLRALKVYAKRCMDIAESERLLGHYDKSEAMIKEARTAQFLHTKLESGG
jgi:hypothetical protein